MLGGGMRQAGILAAAALIALEKSPKRLHEDHSNAKRLADGISQIPGLKIDASKVRTNIVIFDCSATGLTAVQFCEALQKENVLAQDTALHLVRLVTHWNVSARQIEKALQVISSVTQKTLSKATRA